MDQNTGIKIPYLNWKYFLSAIFDAAKNWIIPKQKNQKYESGLLYFAPSRFIPTTIKNKGIYKLKFFRNVIFITSHNLIKEVTDDNRFEKADISKFSKTLLAILQDGLFTANSNDENWRNARKILNPTFSVNSIKEYFPIMLNVANSLIEYWKSKENQKIEFVEDVEKVMLSVIAMVGFNHSLSPLGSKSQDKLPELIKYMQNYILKQDFPFFSFLSSKSYLFHSKKTFHKKLQELHAIVDMIIQKRIENAQKNRYNQNSYNDILNTMLNTPNTDKNSQDPLSIENIRSQMITFLFVGKINTKSLLFITIFMLIKYPNVLEKARAEVQKVLGNRKNQQMVYEDVNQFQYIQQILKEVLRLYPISLNARQTINKTEMIGEEQYQLKKENILLVSILSLHREPNIWGEDASEFQPERFSIENKENIPKNAYMPFGIGKRSCIGRSFAMIEATIIIALIIKNFDIELLSPKKNHLSDTTIQSLFMSPNPKIFCKVKMR